MSEEEKVTETSADPLPAKSEVEPVLTESDLEHISGGIGLEYHQL
jgi:hypothetical protein